MKTIRAPRGFHFKIIKYKADGNLPTQIFVDLYVNKDKEKIGYIELYQVGGSTLETHSSLWSRYRDRGLGSLLYLKAIQWAHKNGYKIRSSDSPSEDARRVWQGKTIKNFFDIKEETVFKESFESSYYHKIWWAFPKEIKDAKNQGS